MAKVTKRAEGWVVSRSCVARSDSALVSAVVASRASRRLRKVGRIHAVVVGFAAELGRASSVCSGGLLDPRAGRSGDACMSDWVGVRAYRTGSGFASWGRKQTFEKGRLDCKSRCPSSQHRRGLIAWEMSRPRLHCQSRIVHPRTAYA